jgi:hypothetical protein
MLRERQRIGIALCASRYVRAKALTFHLGAARLSFMSELKLRSPNALRADVFFRRPKGLRFHRDAAFRASRLCRS